MSQNLTPQQQQQLGKDLSTVLDKYGIQGEDRVVVLFSLLYGEARLRGMSVPSMIAMAMNLFRMHQAAETQQGSHSVDIPVRRG